MPLKQMVTTMSNYNLRFTIKQKVLLFGVDVSIGVLVDISIGFSNLSVYICLLNTNLVLLILISLPSIEMISLFPSLIHAYLFSTCFFFFFDKSSNDTMISFKRLISILNLFLYYACYPSMIKSNEI
jgi:hypothetical protein